MLTLESENRRVQVEKAKATEFANWRPRLPSEAEPLLPEAAEARRRQEVPTWNDIVTFDPI